jgi:hypothetical protein
MIHCIELQHAVILELISHNIKKTPSYYRTLIYQGTDKPCHLQGILDLLLKKMIKAKPRTDVTLRKRGLDNPNVPQLWKHLSRCATERWPPRPSLLNKILIRTRATTSRTSSSMAQGTSRGSSIEKHSSNPIWIQASDHSITRRLSPQTSRDTCRGTEARRRRGWTREGFGCLLLLLVSKNDSERVHFVDTSFFWTWSLFRIFPGGWEGVTSRRKKTCPHGCLAPH